MGDNRGHGFNKCRNGRSHEPAPRLDNPLVHGWKLLYWHQDHSLPVFGWSDGTKLMHHPADVSAWIVQVDGGEFIFKNYSTREITEIINAGRLGDIPAGGEPTEVP